MPAITISEPDQHGRITVTTGTYNIKVLPRTSYERLPTAVYVSDSIAETHDPELAALAAQEAALGSLRYAPRGAHSDVDDLYDRLNARIVEVKTTIAKEALALLGDVVTGNLAYGIETAFFSRKAGCDVCPCSPGVVVGSMLRIGDDVVDIWVEPVV